MKSDLSQDFDLTGRTALITGATSGIGQAIARRLSGAGANLILHYNSNHEAAQSLAEELGNASVMKVDISNAAAIDKMFKSLNVTGKMPDLLVNNAGVQTVAGLAEADETVWTGINNVNLGGIFALTRHFSNALIDAKIGGAIVNIASIEGLDPAQDHAHYAASKAGVIMYTRASALELGKQGIRVNAVSPGLIHRPKIENDWPEGVERWETRAPLGCLGEGADVANAVHFLLSPAAKWISGANLVVDGGMSAQNRW
jgi:3-oxoacyl-[acyl-carrier protein] reductase